jgi:hypothetical protein
MNFKRLVTWLMLGGAGITPLATAQNPVILQGNYVSNVFGQSNFILNPNAQTNTANVTVSNATVSRSTTTPLVATTEFTITTSTATGFADWATRTFDQGMKGQNCEARFSYRGFSVGSTTVQIRQGSNTVAQLTLTASTDPRIASINFPCGDLSSATTLRVQQATASLTGTNEIGGIYVGLATNQANVAQAELVGTWTMSGATNCSFSTTSTSYGSPSNYSTADADCNNPVVTGDIISKGKVLGFDLPAKPGKYVILVQAPMRRTAGSFGAYFRLSDGTTNSGNQLIYSGTSGEVWSFNSITLNTEYSTAGTKTFFLDGKVDGPGSGAAVENAGADNKVVFLAYRFPTSSELVVTPERQNVFGAYKFNGTGGGISIQTGAGSAAPTANITYNNASLTRTPYGKCEATVTANDVGCQIKNMPVGTYEVSFSGFLRTYTAAAAASTTCDFDIYETTTGTPVAANSQGAFSQANNTIMEGKTLIGIFKQSSVADRNFVIRGRKQAGATTGYCEFFADTSRDNAYLTIKPLDQPSNSALYVQGPVLGAQTGAAIPAGYVGEVITGSTDAATSIAGSNTAKSIATLTLTPGVWLITASAYLDPSGLTVSRAQFSVCTTVIASCADSGSVLGLNNFEGSTFLSSGYVIGNTTFVRSVTSTTTYNGNAVIHYTGTPLSSAMRIVLRAVRLN